MRSVIELWINGRGLLSDILPAQRTPQPDHIARRKINHKHAKEHRGWVHQHEPKADSQQRHRGEGNGAPTHRLETEKFGGGDHRNARHQRHRKRPPCNRGTLNIEIVHEQDEARHHSSSRRTREAVEEALVDDADLHIEPRQAQRSAGGVNEASGERDSRAGQ